MLKLMGKKIFTIYAEIFCLSKPVLVINANRVRLLLLVVSVCLGLFGGHLVFEILEHLPLLLKK